MRAAAIVALTLFVIPAQAAEPTAAAVLRNIHGEALGTVRLTEYPGGILIRGELSNLPPGWRAIHIHDRGSCQPDFSHAGGHFNPTGASHGLTPQAGGHAGDLPNIFVARNGTANFEFVTDRLSLTGREGAPGLLDDSGASIVVHAGPDDHATDPAGDSGDRIACGVVVR